MLMKNNVSIGVHPSFKDKENFSILEIKEKNLPHTLINRTLLKTIA